MNIWQALILGLVQGITEFLPISSSGHLALFQYWFGLTEPLLFFDVFLHAASFLAIVIFFWPQILKLKLRDYWILAIGTIPAVVVGLLFKDSIEAVFSLPLLVGIALLVTGLINNRSQKILTNPPTESAEVNEKKAFLIGLFQSVALIPGISRSGSTLFGSLSQGLLKDRAFAFTFLLGVPAIAGANAFQILNVITDHLPIPNWRILLVGGGAALITSLSSLFLLRFVIEKSKLYLFSWYCLVLGSFVIITQLIR